MNPSLTFLALIPLLGFVFLIFLFIMDFINHGLKWVHFLIFAILGAPAWYLFVFLRRLATPHGSILKLSIENESLQPPIQIQKWMTIYSILIIYIGLAIFFIFILRPEELRNWLGGLCLLFTIALLYSGISDWLSGLDSLFNFGKTVEGQETLKKICRNHKSVRNILLLNPIWGVLVLWTYHNTNVQQYFSYLDLFGVLFFLGSFLIWALLRDSALDKLIEKSVKPTQY